MDYTLGNITLKNFGIIPGQAENSNMAITGAWDMPARIGKTFHDWGNDSDGIEPYVLAEEIRFGGRDISFTALVESPSEKEVLRRCYRLYKEIGGVTSLVPFTTDLGVFNVYLKDQVQANYIGDGWCKLRMTFREPVVNFAGTIPAATNAGIGIDGISFDDLGIIILDVDGRFNNPAPKAGQSTSYQHEGYRITTSSIREITIKALIDQPSYEAFKQVLNGLYMLFSKPGLRYITYNKDALRDFFLKDGFTITNLIKCSDGATSGILTFKITEVSSHLDWNFLQDNNGQEITDINGQKIIITQ